MTKDEMRQRIDIMNQMKEVAQQDGDHDLLRWFLSGAIIMLSIVLASTNEGGCDEVKWDYLGAGFSTVLILAIPLLLIWIIVGVAW